MKYSVYRVSENEKIEDVARKFGVSVSRILADNNCRPEQIDSGIRLIICKPEGREYVVKPFDTIQSIALREGVSESKLRENNNIYGEVFIGQKIYI